ncbi:MAG: winged helix-turn-helix domain-containing protein [Acidobacteriota bacterium]
MTARFWLCDWLVEPSLNRIARDGEVHRLEPRTMDLLVMLATARGEVVSKERIIDSVWSRRFVGDSVLTRSIAELRGVLGDDALAPRYIETIHKRGYRVVCQVVDDGGRPIGVERRSSASLVGGDRNAAPAAAAGVGTCALVWRGRAVPLNQGENLIGREPGALLRFGTAQVSRLHARIIVRGCHAVLEDLGSKNGTFLRGARVKEPVPLVDGDEICIGQEVLVVRYCIPEGSTASGRSVESGASHHESSRADPPEPSPGVEFQDD